MPKDPVELALEKFTAQFDKTFGEGVLRRAAQTPRYDVISTGAPSLDYAMGSGGYIRGRLTELWGFPSTGKGHPVDYPVLTPEGWRRIGDLEVGDQVVGRDGYPTAVTALYDRGRLNIYRVMFNDGAEVLCDDDHLWQVRASKGWVTYDTRTLRERKCLQMPDGSTNRYRIPMVAPVQHPQLDLPIDPYLVGSLIANGYIVKTPVLRTNDEYVRARIFELDEIVKDATYDKSTAKGLCINGLTSRLRVLGLHGHKSATKFIPEMYLRGSVQQRRDLLHGLMDGDGSTSSHGTWYSTTSLTLAHDVQALIRSLGGLARLHTEHRRDNGYITYMIRILLPENPFYTPQKSAFWHAPRSTPTRRMVAIEQVEDAEVRCIRVAAEDNLYVTNDYVVTHNTTLTLVGMAEAQKAVPDRLTALIDVEKTYDADWAVAHGVDPTRLIVVTPTTAEDAADQMKTLIESDLFSMIGLDSIGAMLPTKEAEKDAGDAVVGAGAKIVTRMVKTAVNLATKHHVAIILINQVRASIGSFVGPDTTKPGGFALQHCTTHVLKHRRTKETPKFIGSTDYKVQVGHQIAINVEKNKVAPPKRGAYLWMFNQATLEYGPVGIDKATDTFNLAKQLDLIPRSGSNYTMPDTSKHNGEARAITYLREHPEVRDILRTQALDKVANLVTTPMQEG